MCCRAFSEVHTPAEQRTNSKFKKENLLHRALLSVYRAPLSAYRASLSAYGLF